MNADLTIGYKLNTDYKLSLKGTYNKGLTGAREALMADSKVTISKTPSTLIKDVLVFAPSTSAVIPLDRSSIEESKLKTAIEVNPVLVLNLTENITLTYLPRLRKNFHEFTTNDKGNQLTDYSLINITLLDWSVVEKFKLTAGLVYIESWQYDSNRKAPAYLSLIEAAYLFDKKNNIVFGLSSEGQVIDNEQSKDETISFFDQRKSTFNINYNHVF